MILRVGIENLVIVERAEFVPGSGLTSVTGETGAGKTLLATAINLLFGGDADAGHVGAASDEAWVEGEFEVDDRFWNDPSVEALRELRPDSETPLVLARKVARSGRSRALAWGRTIAKGDLVAAGQLLLATAGQHAGRRLMSSTYQRDIVDNVGDTKHQQLVAAMAQAWVDLGEARSLHTRVHAEAAQISERADRIRDDLDRIRAVDPSEDDEDDLKQRRDRARNSTALHGALMLAHQALSADGGSAIDMIGVAVSSAQEAAVIDSSLEDVAATLIDLQSQVSDCASQLHHSLDQVHESPSAIDAIEERLSAYDDLKRHFGGTVAAIIARRVELERDIELVEDMDGVLQRADAALVQATSAAERAADALSASRCAIADDLAARVTASLHELGMADSVFRIEVTESELGKFGSDRVQLMLAPSGRIQPRPVSDVASGGELSRIALALHVASGASEAPTMIFDEIDAGIGGHTAHAIASMLKRLAAHAQVICITHLPQVAARADSHVVIEKAAGTTTLHNLHGEDAIIGELCRMLGADPSDDAARTHAMELRGPRFIAAPSMLAR